MLQALPRISTTFPHFSWMRRDPMRALPWPLPPYVQEAYSDLANKLRPRGGRVEPPADGGSDEAASAQMCRARLTWRGRLARAEISNEGGCGANSSFSLPGTNCEAIVNLKEFPLRCDSRENCRNRLANGGLVFLHGR